MRRLTRVVFTVAGIVGCMLLASPDRHYGTFPIERDGE
jgi:hypothetical protein